MYRRLDGALPLAYRPGMDQAVVIHHYDPVWPELYAREQARLLALLGPLPIAHIGSTAVPGLAARPCVDLALGYAPHAEAALLAAGWQPRDPGWFRLPGSAHDACHLHLLDPACEAWHDHLRVRDYLRARPRAALAYQQLKHVLAARSGGPAAYAEGKSGFMASIVALARDGG